MAVAGVAFPAVGEAVAASADLEEGGLAAAAPAEDGSKYA